MTHEVAMVFDKNGQALYWLNGTGAYVNDSRSLWDVLWEHRENLGGVAHTHPWDGPTGPSGTDMTTWAAIEAGLGKRLMWPIVTMTHAHFFQFDVEKGRYVEYTSARLEEMRPLPLRSEWQDNIEKLRQLSRD